MGFSAVIGMVMLIVWIFVILAIFQIRNATQETSNKLDQIIRLLEEQRTPRE